MINEDNHFDIDSFLRRTLMNDNNNHFDVNAFLKNLCKDTKPAVDAMTGEQRTRFLNQIMEMGRIKPDEH